MKLATASLPLMVALSLGLAACNDPPSIGASPVLQAAGSNPTGSTSGSTTDPATPGSCKESTDANGVPCKICWDSSGSTYYDNCDSGGSGAGTGGAGGTSATVVKCLPTTDSSTGAACKTCYAPDGSYTSTCAPPPSPGCVDASGKNSCGTGGIAGGTGGGTGSGTGGAGGSVGTGGKCVDTTDPSGADCKTCYAADGSVTYDACSPGAGSGTGGAGGSGTGASCIGAPNMETGQICKVCSDAASGKVLFVDCGPVSCGSTSSTTPPTK
jgi:hypothetical protein